MNPFFFGTSERKLFGLYREPARGHGRRGVVLCYPWGQEYLRAHRAFHFLGSLLADAGLHVLRFDYWGTGDSGGDLGEGDAASWACDTRLACDELADMADLQRISLCGLRMGARWAAEAARDLPGLDRLVLWDPVVDGPAYVAELVLRAVRDEGLTEVDGFTLTDAVRAALAEGSSRAFVGIAAPTLVLHTPQDVAARELMGMLREGPGDVASHVTSDPVAWQEEAGDFGTTGMPVQAIGVITEWLADA